MQSHHYLLLAIAFVAGYILAMTWPVPGSMAKSAMGMGG